MDKYIFLLVGLFAGLFLKNKKPESSTRITNPFYCKDCADSPYPYCERHDAP